MKIIEEAEYRLKENRDPLLMKELGDRYRGIDDYKHALMYIIWQQIKVV